MPSPARRHRLPHTQKGLCHVCRRRRARKGQAKCTACHAEWMVQWRVRQRAELEELRAFKALAESASGGHLRLRLQQLAEAGP